MPRQESPVCSHHHGSSRKGPSSFRMHDPQVVFRELRLKPGNHFLDLGCGPGDYAFEAARIVGNSGRVLALDRWSTMIDRLRMEAEAVGMDHIEALTNDIAGPLPVGDGTIDVCLLATVLHAFDMKRKGSDLFGEIKRALKPGGRAAIIECAKKDQPFGPPLELRLSPGDLEKALGKFGFEPSSLVDLGHTYLMQFRVSGGTPGSPAG